MFVNRRSKKFIKTLLNDPNIVDEIDAGNWDKVYDYFLQFLDRECKKRYIRVLEIQADLTRFLLDSGINPLEGQDYMPGFTFYGEFKLEDIPEIPSSIKEIKPFAYSELVTHKPMELRIPGTVKKIGGNAINSCKEITKIIIEDGVKELDGFIIANCENIEYIELPNSLKKIGLLVDPEYYPSYRKTVIKFNGSASKFKHMVQAEMLKHRYLDDSDLLKHFRKLHVIDKNNERIEL